MIGRLNHVAIAVPDLEAAAAQYKNTLGATVRDPQDGIPHRYVGGARGEALLAGAGATE